LNLMATIVGVLGVSIVADVKITLLAG